MVEGDIRHEHRDEQPTAVEHATLAVPEIGPWIGGALERVAKAAADQGVALAGMPFGRYHRVDDAGFEVEAGFPVAGAVLTEGDVVPSSLPAGEVAVAVHVGPYDAMEPTYEALLAWVAEHGGTPSGDAWEVYLSDPGAQPDPATWRTEVVQPYSPT
jgi:effector-binding domain-containing protein